MSETRNGLLENEMKIKEEPPDIDPHTGVEDIVDLLDTPVKEELTIDEDDFSTLIIPNPYASNLSSFPVIKEESVETLLTTKYNPAPFDQNSPSINMEQVYLTVEKNMLVDGKLGMSLLRVKNGFRVNSVNTDGAAALAGILPMDVIVMAENKPARLVDASFFLSTVNRNGSVSFVIQREETQSIWEVPDLKETSSSTVKRPAELGTGSSSAKRTAELGTGSSSAKRTAELGTGSSSAKRTAEIGTGSSSAKRTAEIETGSSSAKRKRVDLGLVSEEYKEEYPKLLMDCKVDIRRSLSAKYENILSEETNEEKKDDGGKQRERKQKIVLRETISDDDETAEDEEKEIIIKKKPTGKSKPGSMKNKILKHMQNGRKFKPSKPSGSSTGPRCNICKKTFKSFLVLSYHKIRCGAGAGALSPKVRTDDQPNQVSSPKIQNVEKAPAESTKSAKTSIPQTLIPQTLIPQTLKVSDTSEVLSAVKQLNVSRSVPVGILSLSRPVSTDAPVGGPYTRPAHPARGGKGCCWDRNKSYMFNEKIRIRQEQTITSLREEIDKMKLNEKIRIRQEQTITSLREEIDKMKFNEKIRIRQEQTITSLREEIDKMKASEERKDLGIQELTSGINKLKRKTTNLKVYHQELLLKDRSRKQLIQQQKKKCEDIVMKYNELVNQFSVFKSLIGLHFKPVSDRGRALLEKLEKLDSENSAILPSNYDDPPVIITVLNSSKPSNPSQNQNCCNKISNSEMKEKMGNEELSCPNTPMYGTVEQLEILPGPIIPSEQDENPQDASVNLDQESSMNAVAGTEDKLEDDSKNIHKNLTTNKEKNSSNIIVKESVNKKDKNSTEDIEKGSTDIIEKDSTDNTRKPDNTEKNCIDKMDNISADMENNCTNKINERGIDNREKDSMKNIEIDNLETSSSDNIEKNSSDKKNLDPSCNKEVDSSNNKEKDSSNNKGKNSPCNIEMISADKMDPDFSNNIDQRFTSTENNSTNKSKKMSLFSEKVFENSKWDQKNRDESEKQKTEAIENLRECIQKTVDNCRALSQENDELKKIYPSKASYLQKKREYLIELEALKLHKETNKQLRDRTQELEEMVVGLKKDLENEVKQRTEAEKPDYINKLEEDIMRKSLLLKSQMEMIRKLRSVILELSEKEKLNKGHLDVSGLTHGQLQNVATCIDGLMSRIRSLNLQLQNIDELVLQTRLKDLKVLKRLNVESIHEVGLIHLLVNLRREGFKLSRRPPVVSVSEVFKEVQKTILWKDKIFRLYTENSKYQDKQIRKENKENVKLGSRVPQFLHKPSIIEEEEEQIENLVIDENTYNSDNNDDGMFDEEDEVTVLYDKDHPSLLSCQKLIKHEISEGSEGNPPENADPAPGIGGGVGDTDKYNLDDYDLDYDSSDLLNPN